MTQNTMRPETNELGKPLDRKTRYKEQSKDRLINLMTKFINTTMIGSIAAIEKHLNNETLSENEFQRVRQEILDNGNKQRRAMMDELSRYDVEWLRYTMKLPVKGA